MEFNEDLKQESEEEEANTLEEKVNAPDIFTELDTQFMKEETASQTLMKKMFLKQSLVDKSDLIEEAIPAIARLLFICDKFNLPSGKRLMNFFMALRVSKDRLGRVEGFGTVKSENDLKMKGNQPVISFLGGKMPQV